MEFGGDTKSSTKLPQNSLNKFQEKSGASSSKWDNEGMQLMQYIHTLCTFFSLKSLLDLYELLVVRYFFNSLSYSFINAFLMQESTKNHQKKEVGFCIVHPEQARNYRTG